MSGSWRGAAVFTSVERRMGDGRCAEGVGVGAWERRRSLGVAREPGDAGFAIRGTRTDELREHHKKPPRSTES